jgi:phosphomannomutase
MSNLFANDAGRHLMLRGASARLASGPAPLPAVQFALEQQRADCALVISARNRPYWYNGLVLLEPGRRPVEKRIQTHELGWSQPDLPEGPPEAHPSPVTVPFPVRNDPGDYDYSEPLHDLRGPYLESLRSVVDLNMIRRATMTIFVDPMNGTTAGYVPAIIGDGNQTMAIEINRETDPLFGKLTPLPVESGLTRLRKLVRESDSHIGLALSADGTSLAVIDKNGEQLEYVEVALLLAAYLARQYRQKGLVIIPSPARDTPIASVLDGLPAWEKAAGLKVEILPQPTARIGKALEKGATNLLVGCTEVGELVLGHYHSYPDALLTGMLVIELVARSGGNLRALLNELRTNLSNG